MTTSYTTIILQLLILSYFVCTFVSSDDRQSYSNRLQSRSFGCLQTTNASVSFQNNVNLLLSEFTQQSSLILYYNASTTGETPDAAYGYFMCRGDISLETCNSCIVNGTRMANDADCEYVDGVYSSELCIFRYSNRNMHGILEMNFTSSYDRLDVNVSNSEHFNRTLSSTLEAVIDEAAFSNNGSRPGFATMEANVEGNERIYTLAQCTPDIVGVNCSRCLHSAMSQLATNTPAATYIMAKCHLRYDNISFYDIGESNDVGKGKLFGYSKLLVLYSILLMFVQKLSWRSDFRGVFSQ